MSQQIQSHPSEHSEWQAQERAIEQSRSAVPASGDARVDAYRAVYHALALAPRSEPPVDFAERTLRAVREAEVDEHIERWMIRIAGMIGFVAVLLVAGPMLLDSLRVSAAMAMLPAASLLGSPLLWAAVAGAVTAGGFDFWQKSRHADGVARA
jgi:hypothetical protein